MSSADELYWVDYDAGFEYNWEYLQQFQDYVVETDTEQIFFNFGTNAKKQCQGQEASVVVFSKSGDSCTILGRHDIYHVTPFDSGDSAGVVLLYQGGGICQNRFIDNFKHRVEFKLSCSKNEGSFVLATDPESCTTILEYSGKCGCAQEYETSLTTKIILFSIYSVLAALLIWICVETFDESENPATRIVGIAKGKILASSYKESYNLV